MNDRPGSENEQEIRVFSDSFHKFIDSLNPFASFMLALLKNKTAAKNLFLNIAIGGVIHRFDAQPKALETYIGNELIELIKNIKPGLDSLIQTLLTTKPGKSVDEIYDLIKPAITTLFNQKLADYNMSLNEAGVQNFITESFIKNDIIPIVMVVRDIPKFCKSIKDKNILGMLALVKSQMLHHVEHDVHFEVRKHLKVKNDGFYDIQNNDPALVSQIKKILNAFQYAEKTLLFIDSMELNPDSGFKLETLLAKKGAKQVDFLVKVLWHLAVKDSPVGNWLHFELDFEEKEQHVIDEIEQVLPYIRQAQSSLLDIDIPMYQVFGQELLALGGVIQSMSTLSTDETNRLLNEKMNTMEYVAETAGDYIGKPLGVFVDQLKPHTGKTDYNFLIRHAGLLPGYLDKLTQLIHSYGAGEQSASLALNQEDSETFKNSAINLFLEIGTFDSLSRIQKSSSLLFPIRQEVVKLGNGAYQQVQRVNAATGDMVVYQLSKIKNQLFAQLLCESDKLELYLGFTPGVLSKPLMQQLNSIYQTLVHYANSIIELKKEHSDLLQLNNTSFLTQRLQHTLQEKNNCELKIQNTSIAKQSLKSFEEQVAELPDGDINALTAEQRKDLNQKYQLFKQFVIIYNPRLSVLLEQHLTSTQKDNPLQILSNDLKTMIQNVKALCDKDMATYACYITLANTQLTDLPKQVKGVLYSLNPKYMHSIFVINEPAWLNDPSAANNSDKKMVEDFNEQHRFIADLTALTPSNRAQLYDAHRIRSLTLKFIHQEINALQTQLDETDWASNTKKTHAIIERYRVLQPFIVDATTSPQCCPIDHECVNSLIKLTTDKETHKISTMISSLKTNLQALDNLIENQIERSDNRLLLFRFAHQKEREKTTLLFNGAPLTLESEQVQRQNKWIRHQRLSQASGKIKDTLYNLLSRFDPVLKLDKIKQSDSVNFAPFPEMEDSLEALEMPSQVTWIKRIINVVHYLNNNFKSLEKLDRNVEDKKGTQYFLKNALNDGINQIEPYIQIIKAYQTLTELLQEPAGQELFYLLKDNYDELQNIWAKIGPLYALNSTEVNVNNPKPVESSGIWYPMLALMVTPKHLKALSTDEKYGVEQAKKAQEKAKETSQYIEEITRQYQASEYVQLFLNSPYMLFKFIPNLKKKLDKFREHTHEVTLTHLQAIQSTLQDILIESDKWEIKSGLRAGSLSIPIKLIMDKLFNGFIEPLGINLQERAELVSNTLSFEKRLEANAQKQLELTQIILSEEKIFEKLNEFLQTIEDINTQLNLNHIIPPEVTTSFVEKYWAIYLLLQSQKRHYEITMNQRDKSISLDQFCKDCLEIKLKSNAAKGHVHHYPHLNDVLYLVKHMRAAKKGNINTLTVKTNHLKAQSVSIKHANKNYITIGDEQIKECIRRTIDSQISALYRQANQFFYLKADYKTELYKSLLAVENTVLIKAKTLPLNELDKMITSELRKQLDLFSKQEHVQLCHLEGIAGEIERFIHYCKNEASRPIYENNGTLGPKLELLNTLKEIVNDKTKPVSARLAEIKKEAEKETFQNLLMAHEQHFMFNLKSLKRLFMNLFNCIFNFLGNSRCPQDICKSLKQEIKVHKPNTTQGLVTRVGLFNQEQDHFNKSKSRKEKSEHTDKFVRAPKGN